MIALILCAGLALAEPDPSIPAPSPTMHPVDVTTVEAEPTDVVVLTLEEPAEEEAAPELTWRQWLYYGFGDVLLYIAGSIFAEAHRGHGAVFILDKLTEAFFAVLTVFGVASYHQKRRRKTPAGELAEMLDDGTETGPIADTRASAKNRIKGLVQQEIASAQTLLRTQLETAQSEYQKREAEHLEAMAALKAAHAEQMAHLVPLAETLEAVLSDTVEAP